MDSWTTPGPLPYGMTLRCAECGLGEDARGVHGAIGRIRPAQAAQVGEREQRVGAYHHSQVTPELREAGRIEPVR